MGKRNSKEQVFSYENSIKKSNELSAAKLYQGLTLNQMQLLAFSIYCTQQNGVTEFNKIDFEKKFKISKYNTEDAKKDSDRITSIKFSTADMANEKFKFWNAFMAMAYDKGQFSFEWNPKMIPHILELKEQYYVSTDLTIASKFRSSFSWTLYDYMKAHYNFFYKALSKQEIMNLFGVGEIKSYQVNTGLFKKNVLDVAIKEINDHTEYEVTYETEKEGRSIVGFRLKWSSGTKIISATKKQIKEIERLIDFAFSEMDAVIEIDDKNDRLRAVSMIRETEDMRQFTVEPISITREKADELIKKGIWNLKELNRLFEKNREPVPSASRLKVEFYNWLEDRS